MADWINPVGLARLKGWFDHMQLQLVFFSSSLRPHSHLKVTRTVRDSLANKSSSPSSVGGFLSDYLDSHAPAETRHFICELEDSAHDFTLGTRDKSSSMEGSSHSSA